MVKLYGVLTGQEVLYASGDREHFPFYPSKDFLDELQQFPGGTKIGVEWFPEELWDESNAHFQTLANREGLDGKVYYPNKGYGYWDFFINRGLKFGHEIVFLEDISCSKRHNEAVVRMTSLAQRKVSPRRGESDLAYHLRVCRRNHNVHKAEVARRVIHELERPHAFLKAIREQNIDVAVVSIGIGDAWMKNPEDVKKDFGVSFDKYSTDAIDIASGEGCNQPYFIREAIPNPKIAYESESLTRMLRVLQEGRVTDASPDFVGTWDVANPARGYFEMFIAEERRDAVRGRIEDCLGGADFTGKKKLDSIRFFKKYSLFDSVTDAISQPIIYEGTSVDGKVAGYFSTPDSSFGVAFYMERAEKLAPLEIAKRWHTLAHADKGT